MRSCIMIASLIILALTVAASDARTDRRQSENAPTLQAVLYGVGEAAPGAVIRLHRSVGQPDPSIDEVLGQVAVPANARWAIRYQTDEAIEGMYFTTGDANTPHAVLTTHTVPTLAPSVPPALIVVRPGTVTSSDAWVVF